MENTLENKAKFFAQYWGQKVRCWDTGIPKELGVVGSTFIVKPYLTKTHLLLKPLSSITDEDSVKLNFKDAKEFLNMSAFVCNGICFFNEIDLIRSLGYAVEWMGLSVEKQIEYGWIKLIS